MYAHRCLQYTLNVFDPHWPSLADEKNVSVPRQYMPNGVFMTVCTH